MLVSYPDLHLLILSFLSSNRKAIIINSMRKLCKNIYYNLRVMDKEQTIQLNAGEKEIFGMLVQYRDQMKLKTVLRVAGGWVRDKVLGKSSHDIDIALDDMKGEEFVLLLKKHAELKNDKISGFGVTKFNPELSKHLETATAHIHGYWIDFVNLRSEKYNEDSRIPIIEIGTPLEDAERRDFTINSMFYNLDTGQVEDWTEKGLSDLENKILRTPLQPYTTFKDDPLRILRCLRFKSRFNFAVEPTIYDAIRKPQISWALLHKVSKERIGAQLSGILKSQNPLLGLVDIKDYDLWNIVFEIPKESDLYQKKQAIEKIPEFSYGVTQTFLQSLNDNGWKTSSQLISAEGLDEQKQGEKQHGKQHKKQQAKQKKNVPIQYPADELKFMALLSTLTFVYGQYSVKVGKTTVNLTLFMAKDQLKYSAKQAKFAVHFYESVQKMSEIKTLENIYPIIRWLRFAEQKWQLAIHFLWSWQRVQKLVLPFEVFSLRQLILKNNLEKSYLTEAPIDGTFLTKKGFKGPIIKTILQNAAIWRITHPHSPNEEFIHQFEQNPEFYQSQQAYT